MPADSLAAVASLAASLSGGAVNGVTEVLGGGNNRLYRVEGPDGETYALKAYFAGSGDGAERLLAEYGGLRFIWQHGVRSVPEPLAADNDDACALFEWIGGRAVTDPGPEDIDAALAFVAALKTLSGTDAARHLPPAREACFSAAELVGQIQTRRERLEQAAPDSRALERFLVGEFDLALVEAVERLRRAEDEGGMVFAEPLATAWQTLSPSDFGFHNALRREDRSLVFLDFEYFGWDDPVKLVSDFLLHPGMVLDRMLRRRFADGAARIFSGDPGYESRLNLFFPFYGLRWAMIVLNEFLPEGRARRSFANGAAPRGRVLAAQLDKAHRLVAAARQGRGVYVG